MKNIQQVSIGFASLAFGVDAPLRCQVQQPGCLVTKEY